MMKNRNAKMFSIALAISFQMYDVICINPCNPMDFSFSVIKLPQLCAEYYGDRTRPTTTPVKACAGIMDSKVGGHW